jgi:hypothetical protein
VDAHHGGALDVPGAEGEVTMFVYQTERLACQSCPWQGTIVDVAGTINGPVHVLTCPRCGGNVFWKASLDRARLEWQEHRNRMMAFWLLVALCVVAFLVVPVILLLMGEP